MEIVELLVANPQLLAAVLAVIYNLAGYVMSVLQLKSLEPYQVTKLAETLILFEAVFTILGTVAGLDAKYVAVIALVAAIVRSLIAKLKEQNTLIAKSLVK